MPTPPSPAQQAFQAWRDVRFKVTVDLSESAFETVFVAGWNAALQGAGKVAENWISEQLWDAYSDDQLDLMRKGGQLAKAGIAKDIAALTTEAP